MTECVADHIPIAASKGVDLGITAQEASEVSGVPAELKILFANLIDNAVRYMPTGGRPMYPSAVTAKRQSSR